MENLTDYPELRVQWHPEKNGNLHPEDLKENSSKKIWWRCPKGPDHVWQASVRDRTRGRGCGYCAGRRVSITNSLASLHPEYARQWHPSKNKGLTPDGLVAGSNKKVWWLCDKGHEWEAKVSHVSKGHWCPYCCGKKATKEHNFAVANPKLVSLWNKDKNGALKPNDVTPKSDKKVWWQCQNGHEWQTQVKNITLGKQCPKCANKTRGIAVRNNSIIKWGSLSTKYPEIAAQWHKDNELLPDQVSPKSIKKVKWRCRRGHVWETQVSSRVRGAGCPKCNNQVSLLEIRIFSELKQIFEEAEWNTRINGMQCDIHIPSLNLIIEVDGYPWHLNHLQRDTRKSSQLEELGYHVLRVRDKKLPPIDGNTAMMESSRRYDIPEILTNILEAIPEYYNSKSKIDKALEHYNTQRTSIGEEYAKSIISQLDRGDIENPLSEQHPHLLVEWDSKANGPLQLDSFPTGSNTIVWWKCDVGHRWQASIASRTLRGAGCQICVQAGQGKRWREKVIEANGSLQDNFPVIAKEWHPTNNLNLAPKDRSSGSRDKVWWKCSKGHEWQMQIHSRVKLERGCPQCAKRVRV